MASRQHPMWLPCVPPARRERRDWGRIVAPVRIVGGEAGTVTGRHARDQRRRLAVRVAQSVVSWTAPGMPVLVPGLDRTLEHRVCPWAVTSGFAMAEETPWSQLCWPQDPDRWQGARRQGSVWYRNNPALIVLGCR